MECVVCHIQKPSDEFPRKMTKSCQHPASTCLRVCKPSQQASINLCTFYIFSVLSKFHLEVTVHNVQKPSQKLTCVRCWTPYWNSKHHPFGKYARKTLFRKVCSPFFLSSLSWCMLRIFQNQHADSHNQCRGSATVSLLDGQSTAVNLESITTVLDLKRSVSSNLDVPVSKQRIFFKQRELKVRHQISAFVPSSPVYIFSHVWRRDL